MKPDWLYFSKFLWTEQIKNIQSFFGKNILKWKSTKRLFLIYLYVWEVNCQIFSIIFFYIICNAALSQFHWNSHKFLSLFFFQLMDFDVSMIIYILIFFSKQPLIWWIIDNIIFVEFDGISIKGDFSYINGVTILWNSQIMGANDSL